VTGAGPSGVGWGEVFDGEVSGRGDSEEANAYLSVRNFRLVRDQVLALVGPRREARILDVGCGTGHFTASLAAENEVVGLDLSAAMLGLAAGRGLMPVRASGAAIPFRDGEFDLVLAISVIQLMPDGAAFVRELLRVARPGGRIVVATINARNLLIPALKVLEREKYRSFRIYDARALRAMIEAAGGTVEATLWLAYPFGWSRTVPGNKRPPAFFSRLSSSFALLASKQERSFTSFRMTENRGTE